MIKVLMRPHIDESSPPSGITTVIQKYQKYLPDHGIEFVGEDSSTIDLLAVHAGQDFYGNIPMVAHCHGLYWTGERDCMEWEWAENSFVVKALNSAQVITVPSKWVALPIQRDMHRHPVVVPHGIDVDDWLHDGTFERYILWNKNRDTDACSPSIAMALAQRFPEQRFVSTYGDPTDNFHVIGPQPHQVMKQIVQKAGIYLSTVKETFGIGVLEAMASGVPVLGINQGGNKDLIIHEVTGYLAKDPEDLADGLIYCIQNRATLSRNSIDIARSFSWDKPIQTVANVYKNAIGKNDRTVSIIIPCFNKESTIERAIRSAAGQADEVIVVDNESTDRSLTAIKCEMEQWDNVSLYHCQRSGVAHARNYGIDQAAGSFIVCLDADDEIEPGYVEKCLEQFKNKPMLGIAYTKIRYIDKGGHETISEWPGEFSFDGYRERNQIPTTCMFRKSDWRNIGGYRQRYAPNGAGSEDADFFLRITTSGRFAQLAPGDTSLFRYHEGGQTGSSSYREIDWRTDKGWFITGRLPFAARGTPREHSHPVNSYEPSQISVIIPVGIGHEKYLIDAIDSVESQTFTDWELILVYDWEEGRTNPELDRISAAFPYANIYYSGGKGAGAARNLGVINAISPYIFFLDADDWLEPNALEVMHGEQFNGIVYSAYYGHAYIDDPKKIEGRVIEYQNGIAKILHPVKPFDCHRAVRATETQYIWCIISCLIPKKAHEYIGGFDEEMESWEDWEYFIRMAQNDVDFNMVNSPLINYRFFSGERREKGGQQHKILLEYIREKHKGVDMAGCCGSKSRAKGPSAMQTPVMPSMQRPPNVDEMVKVRLSDGHKGDHMIRGHATREPYGYKSHGDEFYMDARDIAALPAGTVEILPKEEPEPEPVVVDIQPDWDWTIIRGIGASRAKKILDAGYRTPAELVTADNNTLKVLFPTKTAEILDTIKEYA